MLEQPPPRRRGSTAARRGPAGSGLGRLAYAATGLVTLSLGCDVLDVEPPHAPTGPSYLEQKMYVVGWDGASRTELASAVHMGLVAVRYENHELRILSQCKVTGGYTYVATEASEDVLKIKNHDELEAKLPMSVAKLAARLDVGGSLDLEMTLVGRYESGRVDLAPGKLEGDCAGLTHVITGATIGAFAVTTQAVLAAGAEVKVTDVGGKVGVETRRETLDRSGRKDTCGSATRNDKDPPQGCGAVVQVSLYPIKRADPPEPAATAHEGDSPGIMSTLANLSLPVSEAPRETAAPRDAPPVALKLPPDDPMPSGARWDGVYFSEVFGTLHLTLKKDGTVHGKWQRPRGDGWGELDGEAKRNLLSFRWKEHDLGEAGQAKRSGLGYLQLRRPPGNNVDDRLDGAFQQADGKLQRWEAVQQRHVPPDLDSIPRKASPKDWDR
jgi:hypothetical protein